MRMKKDWNFKKLANIFKFGASLFQKINVDKFFLKNLFDIINLLYKEC